jgi:hypothetical protein
MNLVTCSACNIPRRAPAEIGVCERCRQRNAHLVRDFYAAAEVIERADLEALGALVVYPFRVPMSNLEATRLARASTELQREMRALQHVQRKGPKRAESALEVKHEDGDVLPVAPGRRLRR